MQVTESVWMTFEDVAAYLGVEVKTVRAYEESKLIRAIRPKGRGPGKPVRFYREEIEEFAKTGVAVAARKRK